MKERSKIDLVHALALTIVVGISLYGVIKADADTHFVMYVVLFLLNGFLISLFVLNSYELKAKTIVIRFGPMKESIYYDRIRELSIVENYWSSMALSKKRIKIRQFYKDTFITNTYISPRNFDEFYKQLKKRCKHLEKSD